MSSTPLRDSSNAIKRRLSTTSYNNNNNEMDDYNRRLSTGVGGFPQKQQLQQQTRRESFIPTNRRLSTTSYNNNNNEMDDYNRLSMGVGGFFQKQQTRRESFIPTDRRSSIYAPSAAGTLAPPHVGQRMSLSPNAPILTENAYTTTVTGVGKKSTSRVSLIPSMVRAPQDPRNVKDKQFISESISMLWDFLLKNNFPFPMAIDQLRHPSMKDFCLIFEWMYRMTDPRFELSKDPASEIPLLLKFLGYPFNIPKSSIMSAGAPHTWPTLLAALSWLRELLEYENYVRATKSTSCPLSREISHPEFITFVLHSYQHFLQTGTDNQQLKEQFEGEMQSRIQQETVCINEAEQTKAKLMQKIRELLEDPTRPARLAVKLEALEKDLKKFERLCKGLTEQGEKLEALVKATDASLEEHRALIQQLISEKNDLQSKINSQPMNQQEVVRINKVQEQIQQQIQSKCDTIQQLNDTIGEKEMQISTLYQSCENQIDTYRELCTELKLLSHEKYNGEDNYEISLEQCQLTKEDPAIDLQQKLSNFGEKLHAKMEQVWKEIAQQNSEKEQAEEKINTLKYELKLLQSELIKAERRKTEYKASLDSEKNKYRDEYYSAKANLERQQADLEERYKMVENERNKSVQQKTETNQLFKNKYLVMINDLCETISSIEGYRQYAQTTLTSYKKKLDTLLELMN